MSQDDALKIESGYGFNYEVAVAGLGARAYAFTIDWHIRFLTALLWLGISLLIVTQFSPIGSTLAQIVSIAPALFIYFFYHPVLELMMEGNTPGKRYVKVRVVTIDGLAPSSTAIMLRNIMRIVDSMPTFYIVGIVCCLITKRQVRIGDLAAGTLLVYDHGGETLADSVDDLLETETLSMQELQTVKRLLNRWSDLEVAKRAQLGQALLHKLGEHVHVTTDEKALKQRLENLVSR
ncbi:MAG: putative RDD family membrane protein YckC [Sulfitobacter sp.]|jgi:uncharacterized RDD family membrane protein YckC